MEQVGSLRTGEVPVPDPCPCSRIRVELSEEIEALRERATPAAAEAFYAAGIYRLDRWEGVSRIQIEGEVDLLVDGDVSAERIEVVTATRAELRWWVSGTVSVSEYTGVPLRLVTLGEGTLRLPTVNEGMWVRAPRAELLVETPLLTRGTILVGRVAAAAEVSVGPR